MGALRRFLFVCFDFVPLRFDFVLSVAARWTLRPLGWCDFYRRFSSLQNAFVLECTLHFSFSPRASKQMSTISSVNKISPSTAIALGPTLQSFGWSQKMWIPDPPPHRIPRQNEQRLIFERFPVLIRIIRIPLPQSSSPKHTLLKEAQQRDIRPPTRPSHSRRKMPLCCPVAAALPSASTRGRPPAFRWEVTGLLLLGCWGWKRNQTK